MTWDEVRAEARAVARSPEERESLERALDAIKGNQRAEDPSGKMLRVIVKAMFRTPHPAGALVLFERYFSALPERDEFVRRLESAPQAEQILAAVFGFSEFLSNVLIREPELLWWLAQPGELQSDKPREMFFQGAEQHVAPYETFEERHIALCQWRNRELLRVGVRDVLRLATIEQVTREISDIAHACVHVAAQTAWEELVERYGVPLVESGLQPTHPAGMCVLGMGKLGGRELNFSSDIDLIFIYDAEGETTGQTSPSRKGVRISNHEFFNKMGEKIVKFLSARGPAGTLFRVDMRLRPEGKSGPLARSFESLVNYLEQQARDWERLAYLKARVLTGPAPLRARLYQVMQQFVYDKAEPRRIINEIEKLKLMIDREVLLSDTYHREVKRGYGGIREIEFIIAAMQIIYGQQHPALRVRNIFLAIDRLADVNVLPRQEAEFYLRSYEFLRLVEHRLQMAAEHQTHTLPASEDELEILAKRCHFSDVQEFQERYREVTHGVHERFTRFFERDIEKEARELQDVLILLDDNAAPEEALAVLSRYGIASEHSLRLIRDLAFGTREVFIAAQGQQFFEQMLPSLLRLIARAPLPVRVLSHFQSFMLAVRGITYYYELIAQHPDILRLLVMLFGTSDYFSEVLVSHPEFFDAILGSRLVHEQSVPEVVDSRLREMVGKKGPWEHRAVALRRAVKFEQLITALRFILGLRPLADIAEQLSIVADKALRVAYELAVERYVERLQAENNAPRVAVELFLAGDSVPMTILAFGKYGGRELSFFGDLDIVYVWNDLDAKARTNSPASGGQVFQFIDHFVYTVTENLREGRLFALDARLRPHGRNSPLVTPLSQYLEYMRTEADVWELMAFTRARVVLGDTKLLQRLAECARERLAAFSAEQIRARVLDMRARLEQSVTTSDRERCEYKRSAGGLIDVEFLLQYWALQTQYPFTALQSASYLHQFAERSAGPPWCATDDWNRLGQNYTFLRQVDATVRIMTRESAGRLPADPTVADGVARFLGDDDIEMLRQRLIAVMQETRSLFHQYLTPGEVR
ncbi:MAG: bifunctional [glutamate--ammonia ligase]-adenylyl-L-tyrosine phosphorylase/[glutamate--ammonia-ligase] adenylyltransferase [Candidatus Sumerlaeaceae bacterium]